jgi:hypothetical protein
VPRNPNVMFKVNIATRREANEKKIRDTLYDDGPQTSRDIAQTIGLSDSNTKVLLNGMKEAGELEVFARGVKGSTKQMYWMLKE